MIARLTTITVPEAKIKEAEEIWKKQWGPLIVKQPGCMTHLLMQGRDHPGQFISLSLWASQHVIDEFVASPARAEIRHNTRENLEATDVETELFDIVH